MHSNGKCQAKPNCQATVAVCQLETFWKLSGNIANCNVANFRLLNAVTAQSQSDDWLTRARSDILILNTSASNLNRNRNMSKEVKLKLLTCTTIWNLILPVSYIQTDVCMYIHTYVLATTLRQMDKVKQKANGETTTTTTTTTKIKVQFYEHF